MEDTTGYRAIKIIGECLAPGASLALDGDLKKGALHFAGGVAGRLLLGPLAWFYVGANSYSNSVTQKHLHEHFTASKASGDAPAEEAEAAPASA